jgi:excisionase family DNA binding protein
VRGETPDEERAMDSVPPLRRVLSDDPLLLTPEEAAQVLRVGRTTLYALMRDGDLRPVHIGRSCRLSRAELERYVDLLMAVGPSPSSRPGRRQPTSAQVGGRLGADAG